MKLDDLLTAIAGGVALVPLIQACVGLFKTTLDFVPNKYWPAISVTTGILLSLLFGYVSGGWWVISVIVGAVAGLAAAGLYDYGKSRGESVPPRG